MIVTKKVGITSYGVAIPRQKVSIDAIEIAQGKQGTGVGKALKVKSKTVPAKDEDTITLATDAALNCLEHFDKEKEQISNIFIGSESHPYAVKPSGTVVKDVLGLSEDMALADLQFACKAGTQGMQIGLNYLLSGYSDYSLSIGADTAQAKPNDALEFTAGAGAAAYLLGKENLLAELKAVTSIATDTPDFWRRAGQSYPEHAGRFSGEPAYFYHITTAAKKIMNEAKLEPKDLAHCVFHTPNGKFPQLAAKKLGFTPKQLESSLVVSEIGNTYAGSVPIALSAVLDKAKAGEKILVVSYGSGAGSDAFIFETTDQLEKFNKVRKSNIRQQIEMLKEVSYQDYRAAMELLTH